MKAKILVAEVPFAASIIDVLNDVLNDEAVCEARKCRDFNSRPTFTSTTTCDCRPTPRPEWGIAGEPADEDKIFGAGFEVDEPRQENYAHRWQFESDHEAFDKFVSAGEDCIARGMGKKTNAPIHKVNAIRKRIEDGPVFGVDLIGESHWF